jgi:hypothetical protein
MTKQFINNLDKSTDDTLFVESRGCPLKSYYRRNMGKIIYLKQKQKQIFFSS